ncbi:MAG: tungstate ABC transporter substrate-binding protein WtpA, partial [Candidatus Methanospirareceae archaeon]
MRTTKLLIILILALGVVLSAACLDEDEEQTKVKVIYAGSLFVPFGALEQAFESTYPGIDAELEGHGSIQSIRHITEIHEEFDVIAVADDSLIPAMMYPEYADWYVRFGENQMVIMYSNTSLYADEINESNWYEILARPGVTFGFSNPMLDASGYRTLTLIPLAELYYEDPMIFDELIAQHFQPTVEVLEEEDGRYSVIVPEIFEPQGDKIAIRGGSVQLLALLDFGGIDYAFGYKSVALQHGLRYLELPPELDLSSAEYSEYYRQVTVKMGFQRFKSVEIDR